ncbi:MAG: heme-binding domain-containing protein [Acidobacteriia bacterium]|nr:heme-binding domain-containing protein [Terriglobia bacterium]
MARVTVKREGLAVAVLVAGVQFIPVARENPPIQASNVLYATQVVPANVRSIFEDSCKNCHSNQTAWPWYSYVAPFSWIVVRDVNRGRSQLNFSEWGRYSPKKREHTLEDICEELANGDMPDGKYLLIHRNAKLTQEEREAVCAWVESVR